MNGQALGKLHLSQEESQLSIPAHLPSPHPARCPAQGPQSRFQALLSTDFAALLGLSSTPAAEQDTPQPFHQHDILLQGWCFAVADTEQLPAPRERKLYLSE